MSSQQHSAGGVISEEFVGVLSAMRGPGLLCGAVLLSVCVLAVTGKCYLDCGLLLLGNHKAQHASHRDRRERGRGKKCDFLVHTWRAALIQCHGLFQVYEQTMTSL